MDPDFSLSVSSGDELTPLRRLAGLAWSSPHADRGSLLRQDTEKLVAFLFGVTSHMVADVSWHGLGVEQGFLRTMAAVSAGAPGQRPPGGVAQPEVTRGPCPRKGEPQVFHVTWN